MSSVPERLDAALTGRYRIEGELGEGGMATVYLADDLKHNRKVAIKVLRPELAAVVGGERFLAEIETTANLQHPHILPLYDSGEADSFLFYVMPYVEGESLREKLARERQLPVDEALRIARAVAAGLDYAHRRGVVHRDIKPANILLQDGEPVVADFGIALAVQQAGGGRLTETGLSLGTPYYMSPEQATADQDPGPRSDVYSLGCVLYEMLTGEPPFTGSSAQAVLGKIITGQPARPTEHRKTVPAHVEGVILKSLQKLPADRFGTAADFARALEDKSSAAYAPAAAASAGPGDAHPAGGTPWWLPWSVAGLALALLAVNWITDSGQSQAGGGTSPHIRAVLPLPENATILAPKIAISRNGSMLAVAGEWDGEHRALVRSMDGLDFRPLPGAEGAENIFFSPDGSWLAFNTSTAMYKVPVADGPPVLMDPESDWAGGDWAEDGTLIYSRSYRSGLFRVQAEGGEVEQISEPQEGELAHWWPHVLPGGDHALFTAFRTPVEDAWISVLSLDSRERKDLLQGGVFPKYVPTGHILFVRGEALYAVPFDADALEITGDAVPLVQGVAMNHSSGIGSFDISATGTLVYVPAADLAPPLQLVWVDRQGREEALLPDEGRYEGPSLSPDGRSVALAISGPRQAQDIWTLDLVRGTRTRITSGGGADFAPRWSSAASVVFTSEQPVFDLYQGAADASVSPSALVTGPFDKYPGSLTPDGDTLIFDHYTRPPSAWKVALAGGEPREVYAPDFPLRRAALSPDGRWLAYDSDESGGNQVYLSPYDDPTRLRRQVSIDGGRSPRWTRNGRELVYRSGDRVMSVTVEPESGDLGRPQLLFRGSYTYSDNSTNYDVTPDGQRFLMVKKPPGSGARRVVVVTNFFQELRRLSDQ